ncbi:MAG: DEAD/DEAH box helicase [Prevotellaceae bacterium]|jgi:SNF2 family DNA or RNA helicase|nr:DEAD/DEAH box helicase [Prevotellaceae bacterium]
MHQNQIEYYDSLREEHKQILQAAALKTSFYLDYGLQEIVNYLCKKQFPSKVLMPILDNAVEHGLFSKRHDWQIRYTVSADFFAFVFPKININQVLWDKVTRRSFSITVYELFRNCLYALMYQPEHYKDAEKRLFAATKMNRFIPEYFCAVIEDENYSKYLNKISKEMYHEIVSHVILSAMNELTPWDEMIRRIAKIETQSGCSGLIQHSGIEINKNLWNGNIDKAIALKSNILYLHAIRSLIKGNVKESLLLFKRAIKDQGLAQNKSPLPESFPATYFYVIVLLLSDASVYVPVFRKIVQMLHKNSDFSFHYMFIAIACDTLNEEKSKLSGLKTIMKSDILRSEVNAASLTNLVIYYLVGENIDEQHVSQVYNIVKTAADAGYLLLAYEAAFVATKWFNDDKINNLYADLSIKLNYQPAISQIYRQEDWEKSLNLLLGIKSKTTKSVENKTRVVYYFNPKYENIQPVLQTRQIRGWSKGRNIAMKTFHDANIPDMSDQDLRISKHVKVISNYYDTSYSFDENVFVDLVGHPYIFLENANDTPVEFIAAQIIVSVNKVPKGYQIVTNLKNVNTKLFLEKETNTRYKVYNLTDTQLRIINIVNEQKLVIPESSKEKIVRLLGTLSVEGFTVHSDLVASQSTSMAVQETPADSRIRVQLLPFGDGLKAELFSKPFGEKPPYCKPGMGGKVLISHENNVQLQVKRDLKQEIENERILLNDIQSLEGLNENDGLFSFSNPTDSLDLLDILIRHQDISVVEWPEGEKYKIRGTASIGNLKINIKTGIEWFELHGEFRVDENIALTLQQLLSMTEKSHNRFIELNSGEFLALSNRLKKQLDRLRLFSGNNKNHIQLNKFASVGMSDFFDEMENVNADKQWQAFRNKIKETKVENTPVPAGLQAELRSYQEDGFRWMARLAEWNGGACLADDMGLGKTIQTLAILLHRASLGAALVVCPVSVIGNWVNEAERFAPTLRFKTLGINTGNRKEILQSLEAGNVLVTSYGLLQSEEKLFAEQEFATVVLDEAHVIKNYATKTSKATMQLKAGFRVALTGTPLQNHLGEIWNLFNFINPGLLGSLQHFTDSFVKSGNEQSRKHLKKMISPFILRRTKSAVLDELPPKTEIIKKIELSTDEMAFYEALRRKALENLANADESKHLQVLAEITKLRQASCNPLLIDPNIEIPSSKLATFLDIANELIENNHRALVFSQFVTHLAIARKELDKRGIKYQYIDGSSSQAERERNVKKFQSGEGELFLISLKAGGLGLNLTAADYVIHLDPWWNPAVEDQASDRAHRIGQQRPVTIYRLVAENTIEEKIIQLHNQKRDLAEQLLEGSDMAARLSVNEMIKLIREGVILGK